MVTTGLTYPVPGLVTAIVAVILSRGYAAPLAYIGGSMGTLIGADLLNLHQIQGLGAPVAEFSKKNPREVLRHFQPKQDPPLSAPAPKGC